MITVETETPKVIPSGNPCLLKAFTDNFVVEPGTNQVLFIVSDNKPIDGEVWTFKLREQEFSFTWKDSPNDSGYEISRNFNNQAELDVVAKNELDNIPLFVKNEILTIYIGQPAVAPGKYMDWAIEVSWKYGPLEFMGTSNGGNTVVGTTSIALVRRSLRLDFRVVCSLFGQFDASSFPVPFRFSPLAEVDSNPSDNGALLFNIAVPLRSLVSFFRQPLGAAIFAICPGMTKWYFYRLEEHYYDSNFQFQENPKMIFPQAPFDNTHILDHDGEYFVACHSKMPLKQFQGNLFFLDYAKISESKKFLTERPRISSIHPTEPVWLYYIMLQEMEVELNAKVYLANGASDQNIVAKETLSADDGENIHAVCVGMANNSDLVDFIANRDVVKYEVWLSAEIDSVNTVISETMTFIVEDRDFEECNYILFENTLGGLDTFRCTGSVVFGDETEGDVLHKAALELESKPFYTMANNQTQPSLLINTGLRTSREEIEWGSKIMKSENVWFLRKGTEFQIIPEKSSRSIWNTQDSVYALAFNCKEAYYD
jgi:hypothetical protein